MRFEKDRHIMPFFCFFCSGFFQKMCGKSIFWMFCRKRGPENFTKIKHEGWYKTSKKYFCIKFSDVQTHVINEMSKIRTFLACVTHDFDHQLEKLIRFRHQGNTEKEIMSKCELRTSASLSPPACRLSCSP